MINFLFSTIGTTSLIKSLINCDISYNNACGKF